MSAFNQIAIFDLDGTLVDSFEQIGGNLNKARIDFGFEPLSLSFYKDMVGLPVQELISDLNLPEDVSVELILLFRKYLIEDVRGGRNSLYPRVKETLALLKQMNVGLAIATSKPTHLATEVVTCSPLSEFEFQVQGTDDFPAKPNPEVIHRILNRYPKVQSFMVGDRIEDVLAATSAGIPVVGIAAGSHSEERLRNSGASVTFGSIADFYNFLMEKPDFLRSLSVR